MWAVIDSKGILHQGSEDEMRLAFDVIRDPENHTFDEIDRWAEEHHGDLMLIEIHAVHR